MIGKCVELLVSLPGQSKGNIGEVVEHDYPFLILKMSDGSLLTVLPNDISEEL